jgi:histone acetyltransferase (RNA polymerase elongator complex component)
LLRILIKERAIVRLLKTIGAADYPTRELLNKLGAYGYGHKLLVRAEHIGLVQRKVNKNKVFNKLTPDGKKVVALAKKIGV